MPLNAFEGCWLKAVSKPRLAMDNVATAGTSVEIKVQPGIFAPPPRRNNAPPYALSMYMNIMKRACFPYSLKLLSRGITAVLLLFQKSNQGA